MTDNVIILGAGASVDAGIPVMANFVEKMWEFAVTGKHNGQALSEEDKQIFMEAIKVKNELDGYHGRAAFNDRNLEDILSILSFNLIGGNDTDREKLNWFIKAITRTIELTCTVKHNGDLNKIQLDGSEVYRQFWDHIFRVFNKSLSSFPAFISFNYDLVLERSLLQCLIGTKYTGLENNRFPADGIKIRYSYKYAQESAYKTKYVTYQKMGYTISTEYGMSLEKTKSEDLKEPLEIELLKLHGSLNFPKSNSQEFSLTKVAADSHILPPIINKWAGENEEEMWGVGLQRLREAKNIIIIGYSLPQTDIYMQYFLRAGIGPNVNLNKIIVYNPVLFKSTSENDAMKTRFASCFSPQLQSRIEFNPRTEIYHDPYDGNQVTFDKNLAGTLRHFIFSMDNDKDLFFGNK